MHLLNSLGPGLLQSPDFSLPEMRRQGRATNLLLDTAERPRPRTIVLDADALLPALIRYSIVNASFVETINHLMNLMKPKKFDKDIQENNCPIYLRQKR